MAGPLFRKPGGSLKVVSGETPTADVRAAKGIVTDIGDAAITPRAESIRRDTDEQMVWQEKPSLLVIAPKAIRYALIMIVFVVAAANVESRLLSRAIDGFSESPARRMIGQAELLLFAVLALRLGFSLLSLMCTQYAATSQRLFVRTGVFSSRNVPFEIHQLGTGVITGNLILRLFKIDNLTIASPPIQLVGLRNAEYVRDILRAGGQLEAQRTDKIRWR